MSESHFVQHTSCGECGSSDANALYSDGHTYCWACEKYKHADGESPTEPSKETRRVSNLIRGDVRALVKRGINEETTKFWRYQCGEMSDRPVQIANYCDDRGVPVAQKVRFPDKSFVFLGEPKKAGLYGQWLWRDGGKQLVITEGEIDALTVSQLQGNKWPVVSVPKGAAGAKKSIADNIEWVEKFDKIILFFDDDEPGREAVQDCAAIITPGKAYVARIPGFKDANEAHQSGQGKLVIDSLWGAKEYRPDGVISLGEVIDQAFEPTGFGVSWPWKADVLEKTYGIRPKEMHVFGAGVGVGKSDIFNELIVHLTGLGHKVGVLKFEEAPGHSAKLLAGKLIGKRLHVPGVAATEDEKALVKRKMSEEVFLFDHFGAMDYATVKERMRFMVLSLGCKYVFLDHITALAAAIDGENERKAIDKMCADLSAFVQQLGFTLFCISHLTTPEGKSHEEGGRVLEKHFRGSRAIAQWFHFMWGIERNKQAPKLPTVLRCLKDRYTGDAAGCLMGLEYDRETGRQIPVDLPPDFSLEGGGGTNSFGFKDESGAGGGNTDF
jgi:twinkle protein